MLKRWEVALVWYLMGWIGVKRFASDTTCLGTILQNCFQNISFISFEYFLLTPLAFYMPMLQNCFQFFPLSLLNLSLVLPSTLSARNVTGKEWAGKETLISFKQVPSVNPCIELWIRKYISDISGFMNLCKTLWWCWVTKYTRKLIWDYIELGSQQKTRSRKM